MVHQPLSQGRHCYRNYDFLQDFHKSGKIYISRSYDQIHRLSGKNRHVQSQGHRYQRQNERTYYLPLILADTEKDSL